MSHSPGFGEAIYLVGGTKVVSLFFPLRDRGCPAGCLTPAPAPDWSWKANDWLDVADVWLANHVRHRGFAALVWLVPWLLATPRQCATSRQPGRQLGCD